MTEYKTITDIKLQHEGSRFDPKFSCKVYKRKSLLNKIFSLMEVF